MTSSSSSSSSSSLSSSSSSSSPTASRFGSSTTGTEVAAAFRGQIAGKTILVTGASPNSIGEATALAIASGRPGLLILASRTAAKLSAVVARIKQSHPDVPVEPVVTNLASQRCVIDAARRVRQLTSRLDILINNAGVSLSERQLSDDGIELTFATNHVGPFLLTNLLMPLLEEAARHETCGVTRIVNVSTEGHKISPMRFSDYNFEGNDLPRDERPRRNLPAHLLGEVDGFPGMVAYGSSKTANLLFTVALNRRLRSRGIRSYAVCPGDIKTNLVRAVGPEMLRNIESQPPGSWKSADQGCATSLVAAFDHTLPDADVLYLSHCQKGHAAKWALDESKSEKLWSLSEELTGLHKTSRL